MSVLQFDVFGTGATLYRIALNVGLVIGAFIIVSRLRPYRENSLLNIAFWWIVMSCVADSLTVFMSVRNLFGYQFNQPWNWMVWTGINTVRALPWIWLMRKVL